MELFHGISIIIDLKTNKIIQTVGAPGQSYLGDGSVAADGPLYSPNGKTLWVPQTTDIVRFTVKADGMVSNPVIIKLPSTGPGGGALPSGMALSSDGSKLYVALNGYNTLGVIDTARTRSSTRSPSVSLPVRWSSWVTTRTSPTRAAFLREMEQPHVLELEQRQPGYRRSRTGAAIPVRYRS